MGTCSVESCERTDLTVSVGDYAYCAGHAFSWTGLRADAENAPVPAPHPGDLTRLVCGAGHRSVLGGRHPHCGSACLVEVTVTSRV